jgi:hypothetical protein
MNNPENPSLIVNFDNQIDDEQLRAIEQEVINYSLVEMMRAELR